MASISRMQLEKWLKTIDVGKEKVVDVGGSQNPMKGRTKSWNATGCKILDLEVPHETKKKPDIIGDLNESDFELEEAEWGSFDTVFCIEVMEYIYNPFDALCNMRNLLKKDGILYISTHFNYKFHPPEGEDFLRYTPFGIEKLLTETGFEVLDHKFRYTESLELEAFYREDRMRGSTSLSNSITGSLIIAKKI